MDNDTGLHPLQNQWTLWFHSMPNNGTSWESNLQQVGTFDTVEMFWRYYRNAILPSCLDFKSNYLLFKHGIQPMWEDPQNANGGKWIVFMKNDRAQLDSYWENLILGLIGETVDSDGDEICGAVISRRRGADRIAVWNKCSDDKEKIMCLGWAIKQAIISSSETPAQFTMEWSVHTETTKAKGLRLVI
uniref:EIF-4F 25 kDa subunit n=1 Tax=Spongospora subterranea TaxID=70186 RepID=A0A0H5R7W0_9EUKA|eukprot:CRZ09802.1 hypothetical protein [Spongospora subterranea]